MSRAGILLTCALLAFGAACSNGDGIEVTASFTDVGDLAGDAPVMLADIQVGRVTDIRLAGSEAMVRMSIDRGAEAQHLLCCV